MYSLAGCLPPADELARPRLVALDMYVALTSGSIGHWAGLHFASSACSLPGGSLLFLDTTASALRYRSTWCHAPLQTLPPSPGEPSCSLPWSTSSLGVPPDAPLPALGRCAATPSW